MRRLRYNVAMSADGFIAGPNGEYDWITMDPTIDFDALLGEFDTLIMGRKTFETLRAQGPGGPMSGMNTVVVSTTLQSVDYPEVTIVSRDVPQAIAALKHEVGKDLWLFGGGKLFRTLLDAGLVDAVEVAVMPILLGKGIPVLPPGKASPPLKLERSRVTPSGIVMLTYGLKESAK